MQVETFPNVPTRRVAIFSLSKVQESNKNIESWELVPILIVLDAKRMKALE